MLNIKRAGTRLAQVLTVSAVVVAFAGGAANAQFSPELKSLIAKANAEKVLVTSWGQTTVGGLKGAKAITKAMNKMFGTDIRIKYSPGPSMARSVGKIIAEAKAGHKSFTDISLGPSFTVAEMVSRDLYREDFDWVKLLPGRITPDLLEVGNKLVRVTTTLPGVTVNTSMLPGGKMPTRFSDFLKPEWKGKIAGTPYAAGFEAISAKSVWGPEKSLDLIGKLAGRMSGAIRCSELERIANGEFAALVMDCNRTGADLWKSRGAPIAHVLLDDFAQRRYYYLGVPKNAAHPNLAALYIVFGLTEEGQAIYRKHWSNDLDSLPGSMQGKLVKAMQARGAKFIDVTVPFWMNNPELKTTKRSMVKIIRGRTKKGGKKKGS